jgi:oligosaccharide repeat unit polymerase
VTADLTYLWFTAGFGVVTALALLFSRWPGWIGFPLSILAIRYAVDAGIAPLTRYRFGIGQLRVEDVTIVRPPALDEIGAAVVLLTLGYGAIAAGMLGVRAFASRVVVTRQSPQQMSPDTAQRGYRAAVWLFLVGTFINIVTVVIAGTGLEDLDEIASTRAAYTNQAAYNSVWFNYAWILKTCMQIGALGMLIFAYRLRRGIPLAWGANLLYLAVQPIFGGRTTLIVGGVALALTYHHGVRRLRTVNLVLITAAVLSGLVYIASVRHHAQSIPQALTMSVVQIGSSRAMEEVAFARRDFPDRVPYFMGSTIIQGFAKALPGLDVGQNLWRTLESEYLGYRVAQGIGGQTISTTGESYMNFGLAGVIGIGLLAGIIFGSVYEWQVRNPVNPFAVLMAALVTIIFIVAIYKKLPTRMSDIPMRILVPLGFMAAYAAGGRVFRTWATLAGFVLAGMVMFRLTLSPVVKYATLAVIVVIYIYSVHAQVMVSRIERLRRQRGEQSREQRAEAELPPQAAPETEEELHEVPDDRMGEPRTTP